MSEEVGGEIGPVFTGELTYRGEPLIALQEAHAKIAAAREAIRKFGDETAPALLWAKPRDNVEPFLAELLQILQ